MKLKYELWQLSIESEYIFMDWEWVKEKDLFNPPDYHFVYSGTETDCIDDTDLLNYLFEKFNVNHPEDFKGHSMSVSDVIKVYQEDGKTVNIYYCDSFGFALIAEAKLNY